MLKTLKITLFALLVTFSFHPTKANAAANEIKFAVLAPEGSTWFKVLQDLDKELRSASGDRLGLKIYPGGVSGDEKDVLRKIRIGQLHGGAFTGVGLGQIIPQARIMELPRLFESYAQVDKVKNALIPEFKSALEKKGFVMLGKMPGTGFVHLFTNKAIKGKKDMAGVKMWAWEGDPLVDAMYKSLGVTPIPLALPDVLTSLQTKLIDGVYAPPIGMIALQWFTKVKYMTDLKLAYGTGAMLVSQKQFNTLSPDLKKILEDTFNKYSDILTQKIRQDNTQAAATLKQNGIETVSVDAKGKAEIDEASKSVHQQLAGKLYSPALLQKVQALLN